jgi:HD-GYP domain-containing protein (c-di-GMP phosphodiesterase class II)
VRLAELVAALSLGVDLGFGQPMEHVLRQCLIALRIAERLGLDEAARAGVYYTALLDNVGCHSDAHEQAKWFGDDVALKALKYDYPLRSPQGMIASIRLLGSGNPPLHRFRVGLEPVLSGHRDMDDMINHHARITLLLAEQLGLPDTVLRALTSVYEQWNGKGWPGVLSGEEIPIAARVSQLAEYLEVAYRVGGIESVRRLIDERGGKQFDPRLAALVLAEGDAMLAGLDAVSTWSAVINAEPALAVVLSADRFDDALEAIVNFVDLKSPYFLGHARAVADLSAAAAVELGFDGAQVRTIRRAGLVHDFGRLGVSNSIWDKRGALGAGEWERVRLHPHLTERMLHQSQALAPLGAIAVQHRERLDGSGYPRGLSGSSISQPARIPRRGRRVPGDARAATAAPTANGGRGGSGARCGCQRRPARRGRRSRCAQRRRAPCGPATGRTGRIDRARDRCPQAPRTRAIEQGDRRAARDLAQDRQQPRGAHLQQDRRLQPGGRRAVRDAERIAPRTGDQRRPPGRRQLTRRLGQPAGGAIAAMLRRITAWVSSSSWAGLNCTNSLPGSFPIGMWPGGR